MSLKTWKKEFYPKDATKVSKKDSIAHSLRKWQGLTKANLKKHKLEQIECSIDESDIEYGDFMMIDSDSCALCHNYLDDSLYENVCINCPLYKVLGNKQCDYNTKAPWDIWVNKGNAMPMINALKKALKMSNDNNKKIDKN